MPNSGRVKLIRPLAVTRSELEAELKKLRAKTAKTRAGRNLYDGALLALDWVLTGKYPVSEINAWLEERGLGGVAYYEDFDDPRPIPPTSPALD